MASFIYSSELVIPKCILDYINGKNQIYVENSYYNLTREKKQAFKDIEYDSYKQSPRIYQKVGDAYVPCEIIWGFPAKTKSYYLFHPYSPINDLKGKIVKAGIPISSKDEDDSNIKLIEFSHRLCMVFDLLVFAYVFNINLASDKYKIIDNNLTLIQMLLKDVESSLKEHGCDVKASFELTDDEKDDIKFIDEDVPLYASGKYFPGLDTNITAPFRLIDKNLVQLKTIKSIIRGRLILNPRWPIKYGGQTDAIVQTIISSTETQNSIIKNYSTKTEDDLIEFISYKVNGKFSIPTPINDNADSMKNLLTSRFNEDTSMFEIVKNKNDLASIFDKSMNGIIFIKPTFTMPKGKKYLMANISKFDLSVKGGVSQSDKDALEIVMSRRKVETGADYDLTDFDE